MILVTGATGSIGSRLLPLLAQRDVPLRALAHSPAGHDRITSLGVEPAGGDFDEPGSVERAMEGCDTVFLLSPTHPELDRRETAAIDAAVRAGVRRVVALSTTGADPASPCNLLAVHGRVEEHLMGSGLGYTILRPACFMHLHLLPTDTVKAQGTWYGMAGDGAHAYIDVADIAAAAAAALTGPGHEGAVYELTGPRCLTLREAAEELSEVTGVRVSYVDLPAEAFREALAGGGIPTWLADGIVRLYERIRAGHMATVSDQVERLAGVPPRPYRDFAAEHRGAFVDA